MTGEWLQSLIFFAN